MLVVGILAEPIVWSPANASHGYEWEDLPENSRFQVLFESRDKNHVYYTLARLLSSQSEQPRRLNIGRYAANCAGGLVYERAGDKYVKLEKFPGLYGRESFEYICRKYGR